MSFFSFFWEGSKKLSFPAADEECITWPSEVYAQPWILPVSLDT